MARPQNSGLTKRESEVAVLAAQGLSNQEIADRLFLTRETVKNYVKAALSKTGCRNRTELANWHQVNCTRPESIVSFVARSIVQLEKAGNCRKQILASIQQEVDRLLPV